jgi:hypothetical protein
MHSDCCLIVVGLARCIAMVLNWKDLACGDREALPLVVAINSVIQILAYALPGTFHLTVLPGWLGLDTQEAVLHLGDRQGGTQATPHSPGVLKDHPPPVCGWRPAYMRGPRPRSRR